MQIGTSGPGVHGTRAWNNQL